MEGEVMPKLFRTFGWIVLLGTAASTAFGQEFTAAQVLAKLDEKAKVFSALEASVAHTQTVARLKHPTSKGKIYIKVAKGVPRYFWDVSEPKQERMKILIDKGELKAYFPTSNSYRIEKANPNSEELQLLLIGFGVRSATLSKNYTAAVAGRETVGAVQAIVLELTSISTLTTRFPKVTLWLDPQTWTPVRTRVTEVSKDFTDFNYSEIRLNKGVSDSKFSLKIPSNATKQ
jgi:outer membrane lipoprotein-sorting protein